MKIAHKLLLFTVLTGMLGIAIRVLAHDAWVAPGVGPVYRILYGHKVPEPYKSLKVTSVKAFDDQQRSLSFSRTETPEGLTIKTRGGTPALFAVEFDNGYWVTVGNERRNVRFSQLPAGTQSTDPSHPLKFSKTVLHWYSWMARPLGQRIEFVPVGRSTAPRSDSLLSLQLLLNGKPLAGQMVENNSNEQGPKTDSKGMVTVRVLKGINRFATDYDISQPDNPDARRLSLTAALVFIAN